MNAGVQALVLDESRTGFASEVSEQSWFWGEGGGVS